MVFALALSNIIISVIICRTMTPGQAIAALIFLGLISVLLWKNHQERAGLPRELLEATKGNKALAKRLLANARQRYPGKSDRWYVEKVIYDLERDGAGGRRRGRSLNSMSRREVRETFFLIAMLTAFSSYISNWFR
jgi:hypothetical protein